MESEGERGDNEITGSGPSGAGARRFAFRPLVHRSNPGSPPTGGAEGSKDGKSSGDRSSRAALNLDAAPPRVRQHVNRRAAKSKTKRS